MHPLESGGGDLRAAPTRRLTQLEGIASINTMRTFDLDPDPARRRIVFDELLLNSDIVLFERNQTAQ